MPETEKDQVVLVHAHCGVFAVVGSPRIIWDKLRTSHEVVTEDGQVVRVHGDFALTYDEAVA